MSDKFWCLVCGANVEGKKEVREFPAGERVMKLTTVHCEECGLALVRINHNMQGAYSMACPGANCGWSGPMVENSPIFRPEAMPCPFLGLEEPIIQEIEDYEDGDAG